MAYVPSSPHFIASANVDISSFAPSSFSLITTDSFVLTSSDDIILTSD